MKNRLQNIVSRWGWKLGIVALSLFTMEKVSLAANTITGPGSIENPIATDSFAGLLNLILNVVIEIGIPVIVIFIIITGFKFVTAQGNSTKIEEAKKSFYYVIIGSAIILACRVIVAIIESTIATL